MADHKDKAILSIGCVYDSRSSSLHSKIIQKTFWNVLYTLQTNDIRFINFMNPS
jgi:hypothetical protein